MGEDEDTETYTLKLVANQHISIGSLLQTIKWVDSEYFY